MTTPRRRRDLVLVVADKDIEQTMRGLLSRPRALGIRGVDYELLSHPGHDPGCYTSGHALISHLANDFEHALVVFDLDWDGAPSRHPGDLEAAVTNRLSAAWGERAACVVIAPEIEGWVFSDSPNVDEAMGWADRKPPLREWLATEGYLVGGRTKPSDPKVAFEKALRVSRERASSSLFEKLAKTVSVERCTDPSFKRLLEVLRGWFGTPATAS